MKFVCPTCRGELRRANASAGDEDAWICDPCGKSYPIRDRVVRFLDGGDPFYEGLFTGTTFIETPYSSMGRLLLSLRIAFSLDMHYTELLRHGLGPEHRRILDLGCGGGNYEVVRHGAEVVGVDLSVASLCNAAVVYACAVQASASRLPFPDGYFDAIVSSNFLGHVLPEERDAVYSEMQRVLRPGGRMIHQMETSSNGALFRFARRDSEYYRKQLIELDGHFGIELPSGALKRFRDHGFEVERVREDFVWYFYPAGEANKRFDNEYSKRNIWLRILVRLDKVMEPRPRLRKLWNLTMGIVNELLCRLTPIDRKIGLRVTLRKRN